MGTACPDLEQLDEFVADASPAAGAIREHVSRCIDCQARLAELSDNQLLFVELSGAASQLGARLIASSASPPQIPTYDIIREVGRGGMGVVYEARQRHPPRRVALKVLRGDYSASEERIRLFDREVRALARLQHPGITSIFETGVAACGPFYAMEFIEGCCLTEYARSHGLGFRQKLQLFLKLCEAINHAHLHGVIHRDLKPGNVLIQEGGALKVLDFGLARITDSDVTGASLAMDTGRIVGTLAYMSPEQTRGMADEIDLRSDVYSLGVILFELLTGVLPYEVSRTSVPSAVRSICESPPRRPASAAAARSMDARLLRGDLETIIFKTLEKLPQQRYQSVAALSEDIERFLSHQPIVARPPNAFYQFRKLARRNRVLIGGIASVFVALGIGIVTTGWQAWRARKAEQTALAEASTSAEISHFLANMFDSVSPAAQGPDVRVVELLKHASADIDKSFAGQPRVALGLRDAIGRAYQSLTLYPDAQPHFEAGLKLARQEYGDASREALKFQYFVAEAMAHNGGVEQSMKDLVTTLAVQTRVFGTDDPDTLRTRHFLAVLKVEIGEVKEGEALLRETLAGRMRALGPEHELTLDSMANLGVMLLRVEKREEGAALLRRAHEIALRVFGPDSVQTLLLAGNVATLARSPAELEAVEPIYRDIVERGARAFGPDHQQTLAYLGSLSQLLELRCKYEEAAGVARDLYERLKRSRGERDAQALDALSRLARLTSLNKKWDEAERLSRQVVAARREVLGESAVPTLDAMYDLAQTLSSAGRLEEALKVARGSLALREKVGGKAVDTALTRTVIADILRKLGRLDESHAEGERALRELRADSSADAVFTAWAEGNFGTCLRDQQRFAEAEPLMRHAYDLLLASLGPCHPICGDLHPGIKELYRQWHAAEPGGGHDRQLADFESKHADAGDHESQ